MKSGVRKSGWPMPRLMMSRPCAISALARASTAKAFSSPMRSKAWIVRSMASLIVIDFARHFSPSSPRMQSARELNQETKTMPTIADKRRVFHKLHETGCFVIPNPWDIGSARYLAHLGFKALATTSAGFAFTRALPDGGVPRHMVLAHIREIVEATD